MYHGDIALGSTIDIKFSTRQFSTGAPYTLAGTPSVAAYPGNSTTEITAGITLTVDFDSRTGLHNVRVVATSGNGYATATDYALVITAGTVDSVSVVGEVIGSFSIENRSSLRPTTAGRTLDVSSGGEAGVDWANVGSPTTAQNLSGTSTKAVEPTVAGRTLDISATGEAGVDWANVGSPTTTVGLSNTTIKTATDVETDTANIQTRIPTSLVSGRMDSSVGAMAANVLTATAIQDAAFTAAKFASGAFDAVWSVAARLLTAGTNIVLAKGVGVTGFNDLSAAQVNAECDTAIADASLATAASIAALNDLSEGDIRTAVGLASANLDTQLAALPTDAEVADKFLGRNIAGGSDGGRTVTSAFRGIRNKVTVDGTTITVYAEDDSTPAWTGAATRDSGLDTLKEIDPS